MKIIKIILNTFLVLIGALIILWMSAALFLQTKKGQKWAVQQFVTVIEKQTDTRVEIRSVELFPPLKLRVKKVYVYKDGHSILNAERLDLTFLFNKIIRGQIGLKSIDADRVELIQLPFPIDSINQAKDNNFDLNPLEMHFKVKRLNVTNLKLDPQIIDQIITDKNIALLFKNSLINIQGRISNNPFKNKLFAECRVALIDPEANRSPVEFGLNLVHQQLTATLKCARFPLDFLSKETEHIFANINTKISGKLTSWKNLLNNTTGEPVEGSLELQLSLEKENTYEQLIGSTQTLKSNIKILSKDDIQFYNSEFSNPYLKLNGEGNFDLNANFRSISFKGTIKDAGKLVKFFSPKYLVDGQVSIQGDLNGSLSAPNLNLLLKSSSLNVNKLKFKDILSRLNIHSNGRQGFLDVHFIQDELPYEANAAFSVNKDQLSLKDLQVKNSLTEIVGSLDYFFQKKILKGQLNGKIDRLEHFSSSLSIPVKGDAQVQINFAPDEKDENKQSIDMRLSGNQIQWDDFSGKDYTISLNSSEPWERLIQGAFCHSQIELNDFANIDFQAKTIRLDSSQQIEWNPLTIKQIDIEAEGTALSGNNFTLENLSLNGNLDKLDEIAGSKIQFIGKNLKSPKIVLEEFSGETNITTPNEKWPFKLDFKTVAKEDLILKNVGFWNFDQGLIKIELDQSEGRLGPYPIQLIAPTNLIYKDEDNLEVDRFNFVLGDGKFESKFALNQKIISGQFKAIQIPSELFHFVSTDVPLAGRVSLAADLNGPLDNPQGYLTLSLHNIQIVEKIFSTKPLINGQINFKIADSGLLVDGSLLGVGKNPVIANGTLPIKLSLLPLDYSLRPETPFKMYLKAEGELDPYLNLFYNESTNITGQTKIEVMLSGDIHVPQVEGKMSFTNGSYESLKTGAMFKNINAQIEGDGKKLILKSFSAHDNKQGSITATGALSLDAASQFPFEIHIQPKSIDVINSDYASVSASGDLTLSGNTQKGKLQGHLNVDKAIIRLEEALPSQIKTVDVKYINTTEKDSHLVSSKNEGAWPLQYDIKAESVGKIIIEGKKIHSTWKGELNITGTPANPLANGEIHLVEGEYDFNGRKFPLTQGMIHFAGPFDKKTSIYVVASKEVDKIHADIIIKGPTNKLSVSFRSNPPMSQREVLSYILFNRGISDITPDQGDVLSQSFLDINSDSEQPEMDILTRLRKNIGIDRLDLTSTDSENKDLALQVGKYITEGVFVSINKSINDAANRVAIEAKLHKNVQAEAEVSDDAQGKIMLKWKKDY